MGGKVKARVQKLWRELRMYDDTNRLDEVEEEIRTSVRWLVRLQIAELLAVIGVLGTMLAGNV